MARWAPQRTDTLHALAEEVLQNYAHGRVVMAIDGPDVAVTGSFADDLAVELRGLGNDVERASVAAGAELDAVRAAVVAPFRAPRRRRLPARRRPGPARRTRRPRGTSR